MIAAIGLGGFTSACIISVMFHSSVSVCFLKRHSIDIFLVLPHRGFLSEQLSSPAQDPALPHSAGSVQPPVSVSDLHQEQLAGGHGLHPVHVLHVRPARLQLRMVHLRYEETSQMFMPRFISLDLRSCVESSNFKYVPKT